jgi:hypothetical protein
VVLTTTVVVVYPFPAQTAIRVIAVFAAAATLVAVTLVVVETNRDVVLSLIAGTTPGRISWNPHFVVNLVAYGSIPVFALLQWLLPGTNSYLFGWIGSLIKAVSPALGR